MFEISTENGYSIIKVLDVPFYLIAIRNVLEIAAFFVIFYSLLKFVFFKKMMRGKKGFWYYFISIVISAGANVIFRLAGVPIILLSVYISTLIGNGKFKPFRLLELVPLIGITIGFVNPFEDIPDIYFKDIFLYSSVYHLIGVYAFVVLIYIFFNLFLKKQLKGFEEESKGRTLSKKELFLLSIIGIIASLYPIFTGLNVIESAEGPTIDSLQRIINIYDVIFGISSYTLALVGVIVIMIANKRTFYHTRVLDMQSNIISMMAEIIENRDENTGGHIQRTAKYVEIIANQLKEEGLYKNILTDEYINDMRVAAPLHDIGKIHVSDLILNKPGKLEPGEFEIMKTHAAEGRKLLLDAKEYLGNFNYLDIAVDMAGSHHEWWDGSPKGYPDHKKGEEIPLCARIMAVADVFDALTSKRCYRDAMALDKAYKIIREERGTHFDKTVVDAFFAANPQIEEALNGFLAE